MQNSQYSYGCFTNLKYCMTMCKVDFDMLVCFLKEFVYKKILLPNLVHLI